MLFVLGFKGFFMNIINLKSMYELYVKTNLLPNLPTMQLSQDFLESLFSRIRSMNGNCDNPPVMQFTSALRKILIRNEITSSAFANCVDNLKLMTVSSRPSKNQTEPATLNPNSEENDFDYLQTLTLTENDFLIDCCGESTIASIASSIEQKILNVGRFECDCQFVLTRNDKVTDLSISDDLTQPCISTLYVCKVTNILFNLTRNRISFNYEQLVEKIMQTINFNYVFESYFECDLSHKLGFVMYIVEEFIRLQATYIAKNVTLIEQKIICRKFLQKLIHYRGQ